MSTLSRISAVEHLGDYRLRLTFSDGLVREIDFAGVLIDVVFTPLQDLQMFGLVAVGPVSGAIGWPIGVDLDPDVLRGDAGPASAKSAKVLCEFRLGATGESQHVSSNSQNQHSLISVCSSTPDAN